MSGVCARVLVCAVGGGGFWGWNLGVERWDLGFGY